MTLTASRPGQLIRCVDLPFGVAKLEYVEGDTAVISFFESVASRFEYRVSTDRLVPHRVYPQNRCYVQGEGNSWRVGRVVDLPDSNQSWYGVQFPNGKFEEVPERHLYLRWSGPIRNPAEVLELYGHETPYWFDRRWPMVEALTAQRAAARGLNALLSSAIELRDHQVDVALRVLQDPVQRYLLADEVGLGKTIEAGLIIRQRLLDEPKSRVVLLVPDVLVAQWQAELHTKFFLSDFPHSDVQILGQSADAWPEQADLVVVDEAHHLAAQAYGAPAGKARYARLARLAHASPRLLLLSATPAASDQRGFLSMLHLLEPEVYRLDDLPGFERRVAERASIGALFYSLEEDTPDFLLEDSVKDIRTQFPDDAHLMQLCAELEAVLEDEQARVQVIRAIRVHVSETYRLHRRMLRHRRAGRAGDVVRGRTFARTLPWSSGRMQGTWAALDEWREALALAVERRDVPLPAALAALTDVYEASQSPLTLAPVLSARLGRGAPRRGPRVAPPLFPGEEAFLSAALHLLPDTGSMPLADALTEAEWSGKTVVFTGGAAVATDLSAILRSRLGDQAVAQHVTTMTRAAQEAEVERFCQEEACTFLIADHSAEEGLNLQFAQHLVHADLPLSTNRLEQRLGRLDRYGRGEAVPSHVLMPDEPPAWLNAWFHLLRDHLSVFDTSVAALQFLMDELRPEITTALLGGELNTLAVTLSARIEQERTKLQRQDALDAIDLGTGAALTETMDALYESELQPFSRVMQNWMLDALRFRSEKDGPRLRFMASPERPATLVPWERLRDRFAHLSGRTGTFSRGAAVRQPGTHLYRLGEPTVDALHEYLNWDDRGQTYAFWRFDEGWAQEDLFAFRFNYLVEGNMEGLTEHARTLGWDEGALRRRLDALLPPRTHTVWLTHRGRSVPDAATEFLTRPFGKVKVTFPPEQLDHNLNWERLWALREHFTDSEWVSTCQDVHRQAEHLVRSDPTLEKHLDLTLSAAQRRLHGTLEQLRTRAARLRTPEAHRELDLEERLTPLLLQALRVPFFKLDSVGFTVLSSRDPFINEVPSDAR